MNLTAEQMMLAIARTKEEVYRMTPSTACDDFNYWLWNAFSIFWQELTEVVNED